MAFLVYRYDRFCVGLDSWRFQFEDLERDETGTVCGLNLKKVLVLCSIILFCCQFPFNAKAQKPSGDISFQPNVIPDVDVYYHEKDYSFVFSYKRFFIRIRPFVIYNNKTYGMKAIIGFLKSKGWFEHNYKWLVDKAVDSIHYGFNLTKLPKKVADKIDYLGFKVVERSFPLSWFRLETVEFVEEGYNVTRIHVPKANLVFSFEDLYPYGYSVEHINATWILIGNVRGRENLFVDPITYSAPTITVIGGTEGSELDTMDIWNEDQSNGWNVVHNNNGTNRQFEFNCLMVFGNGTTAGTTWFADEDVQWLFNDGIISAHYQKWMELKRYAHVRFGALEDATEKTTGKGCSFISLENSYFSYIVFEATADTTAYFYSCSFDAEYTAYLYGANLRLYNSIAHQKVAVSDLPASSDVFNSQFSQGTYACLYPRGTWDKATITEMTYALYTAYDGTITNLYARKNTYLLRIVSFNSRNLYLDDCDSDTWALSWHSGDGEVWRRYSFDLTVTYPNGTAIPNANVTITYDGQGGGTIGTWLTDANGQIPQQTLSRSFYNQTGGNTEYAYYPFNLTITFSGYDTYTQEWTPDEEEHRRVALTEASASAEDESYLWWTLSLAFLPLMLVFLVVWRNRRARHGYD